MFGRCVLAAALIASTWTRVISPPVQLPCRYFTSTAKPFVGKAKFHNSPERTDYTEALPYRDRFTGILNAPRPAQRLSRCVRDTRSY